MQVAASCCRDALMQEGAIDSMIKKLGEYIKATSQDISQEVKTWVQMGPSNEQRQIAKWLKDNKVKVFLFKICERH